MKVLHVLESSIPDTGGYVVRAQSIIDQQKRLGMEVAVVTSPLFPAKDDSVTVEHFADVPHFRTNFIPSPRNARSKLSSYLTRVLMMHRYRKAVMRIVEQERPDILHAHSSYLNPLAALPAARRFGLPLVYEVRTLWGESAVVEGVCIGSSAEVFEEIVQRAVDGDSEIRYRVYFGCAGWAPGQLEGELARSDWRICDGSAEFVFRDNPYEIWELLMADWNRRNPPVPGVGGDHRLN